MNHAAMTRWLAGGLDLDRRPELSARIAEQPELMLRLSEVMRELEAEVPEAPRWRVPPMPVGMTLRAASMTMGPSRGHTLAFDTPEPHRLVVVLWDRGEGWTPLFPATSAEQITAAELPVDTDGRRLLDVVRPEQRVRWAVLLPEDLDWPDPWPELQRALTLGRVPVATVTP